MRLSVLSNALFKLLDILLDALVDAALQLWPITEGEQDLEPNEEGCQEERLGKVIQQRGSPALEFAVTDELRNPACNVDAACPVVRRGAVGRREMMSESGRADQKRRQKSPCYRFHENVKGRV